MKKIKNILFSILALSLACFTACEMTFDSVNSHSFEESSDSSLHSTVIESEGTSAKDSLDGGEETSIGGITSEESFEDSVSSDEGRFEDSAETSEESSSEEKEEPTIASLSIHFMQLGNKTSGDCTLIKTGDTEVLIDAGSTSGSADTIVPYIQKYCTDGVLEYVIATHGDQDHIASFVGDAGIFASFDCGVIIDFTQTTKTTQVYKNYVSARDAEVAAGAKHYTALECWKNENGAQRNYTLGEGVTMNILYQKYYETKTSTENNYSVCTLFTQGEKNYLFTGDLEESGEKSLVASNDLPECALYKAGHHGSNTSSTAELLAEIKPKIVVASCCCGDKYDFPHQEFIDNISIYTDRLYIPSMVSGNGFKLLNGDIVVSSDGKNVSVNCSNNNVLFKDTEWFKTNRKTPDAWK